VKSESMFGATLIVILFLIMVLLISCQTFERCVRNCADSVKSESLCQDLCEEHEDD
jgi:hypothetical protein